MKESLWFVIGTAIFPIVRLIYPDIRYYFSTRNLAKKAVADNLDPILKASDELYSKITDLAKRDFKAVYQLKIVTEIDKTERVYILYLFASFFGRVALLRRQNHFSYLSKIRNGRRLLKFLMSFESKSTGRMLNRATQRLIGDAMITTRGGGADIYSLYEFNNLILKGNAELLEIALPLDNLLFQSNNRLIRQRILYFGILVKAFIDYFDAHNFITKERQTVFVNKLSSTTKHELEHRVFKLYLDFVRKPQRYYKQKKSPRGISI